MKTRRENGDAMNFHFPLRRVFLLFPLLLLCTSSSPAVQHPKKVWKTIFLRYSATDLRDNCRDFIHTIEQKHTLDDAALRGAVCQGYVLGAVDGMAMAPDDSFASRACVPENAMDDELIRVTLKYFDEHPKDLPTRAGIVVWRAMVDAYPCPAK